MKAPNTTTIQITAHTKKLLDSLKKYRRETYNDLITRILEEHGKTGTRKKEDNGNLEKSTRIIHEELGTEMEF